MAVPATAFIWAQSLDPTDLLDFTVSCEGLLEGSEIISSYTLVPMAESVALGLQIKTTGGYATTLIESNKSLNFWLCIDEALRGNIAFADAGVTLPIELTITTNASPPRVKQRTLAVKVKHL